MTDRDTYQIEIADRIATLYVTGSIPATTQWLIAVCNSLPRDVEVMRVNLEHVDDLRDRGLAAIDRVRQHWHATRSGSFRVTFAFKQGSSRTQYQVEASA
jgi:hypothetical protein